jgi:hypothetical protein
VNEVWVVVRRPEGDESFDAEVFQAVYASRELAKEHYALIDGPDAHDWDDDEKISISYLTGLAIVCTKVLDDDHLRQDREWRDKLGAQ